MHRLLAILLALATASTACSGGTESATPTTTEAPSSTTEPGAEESATPTTTETTIGITESSETRTPTEAETPTATTEVQVADESGDPGGSGEQSAANVDRDADVVEPETAVETPVMTDEDLHILEVATSGTGSVRPRPEGVVDDGDGDVVERVYLEIGVRAASGGGMEVALRVNATATEWLPQERLFDYEAAPVGGWWFSSAVGSDGGGLSAVRVQARRLDDGRVEMGMSTPSGDEVLPRQRFVPREVLTVGGWSYTSPVAVDSTGEPAPPVPDGRTGSNGFLSVSTGHGYNWDEWSRSLLFGPGHGCGIRADRTPECWGNDWDRQASPPDGVFAAVDAGWTHTCAIRVGGDVTCWGTSHGKPPAGPFVTVSAGNFHTCGLRPHGGVDCWGDDSLGQSSPPEGIFVSVSAGKRHTCGLRAGGRISCWGSNTGIYLTPGGGEERFSGQAQPPSGEFTAVSAGSLHTCGIRPDGAVECWGNESFRGYSNYEGPFISVSAADDFTCGLLATGLTTCWTSAVPNRPELEDVQGPSGEFVSLSAGDWGVCGIRPDGAGTCWLRWRVYPPRLYRAPLPPAGQLTALSAGRSHTCGIQESGTVTCWDDGSWTSVHGHADPPPGRFVAIDAGGFATCGIRVEGDLRCWGRFSGINWWGVAGDYGPGTYGTEPPTGLFESVSVGSTSACALRPGGEVACWGEDDAGQSSPPEGTFTALAAGGRHVCGLRPGGEVSCWGDGSLGQTASPEGVFTTLSAGNAHTCGLRSSGEVACWGNEIDLDHIRDNYVEPPDEPGAFEPPGGTFVALSAGAFHTCGLRAGGDVECWPIWGVEGDLDDEVTFPVSSVVPALAANTQAGRFTTLRNPVRPETPQREPGAPDSGTSPACDTRRFGEAVCRGAWGQPDYSWTPVLSPIQQPGVWRDSRVDPLPGPFVSLSSGWQHTCGIRPDGTVDCWNAYEPRN